MFLLEVYPLLFWSTGMRLNNSCCMLIIPVCTFASYDTKDALKKHALQKNQFLSCVTEWFQQYIQCLPSLTASSGFTGEKNVGQVKTQQSRSTGQSSLLTHFRINFLLWSGGRINGKRVPTKQKGGSVH